LSWRSLNYTASAFLLKLAFLIVKLPLESLDELLPGLERQSRDLRVFPVQSAVGEEEGIP